MLPASVSRIHVRGCDGVTGDYLVFGELDLYFEELPPGAIRELEGIFLVEQGSYLNHYLPSLFITG